MYPNDNRYPDSMPNIDGMTPPMYNNQMRTSSIDMSSSRPPYYDSPYYDKAPPMMQQPPMYDYMSQPPMMPMNQSIDPRYSSWRQSSENRGPIMPSYYDRPPMSEPYMHQKAQMAPMSYPDSYPQTHDPMGSIRPSQMNLLQRISFLIKPQLPELKKIMVKAANSATSLKKKQVSKRQRSYERERPRERQRSRSHQKKRPSNSSSGEWVCSKCSFLNFDWRDKCMKCTEPKPSFPSNSGKNFIPGPEDWKCYKCGNLNYARRVECNRCKLPKSSNK